MQIYTAVQTVTSYMILYGIIIPYAVSSLYWWLNTVRIVLFAKLEKQSSPIHELI